MDRRTFIAAASVAAITGATARASSAAAPGTRVLSMPPGVQLWTVGDRLPSDFAGTLRSLYRIGYRRVEAAGWAGRTPDAFRRGVEDAGLACISCHFPMDALIADPARRLGEARDAGVRHVVASSPAPDRPVDPKKPWPVAVAEAMTLDAWRRNADAMNRIAAQARTMGLRFGYHNHPGELVSIDGRWVWDMLMRSTDPALVDFELDIGWVAAAGHDPASILRRDGARITLLHVKDIATRVRVPGRIADDLRTTPVGSGSIDWQAVFDAAGNARIEGWFVEQEQPFVRPPLDGLRRSLSHLRSIAR